MQIYSEGYTRRKLVFLDIDGTLMDGDGYIPPSALTACREARRQGHLLYICSGRPRVIISDAVLAVGFDGVVSSGGAHIEKGNTASAETFRGEPIFDATIPVETVKRIAAYLDEQRCGFSFENTDSIISNRYFLRYWETFMQRFTDTSKERQFAERIAEIAQNLLPENSGESYYTKVNKILFVQSGSISFAAVHQTFAQECEIFHGSISYCGNEGGEISPPGVHKGSAVTAVARHYGISLADTIAFGDSDNDRPMLEIAGIGVAMGNAEDGIKAIAGDITTALRDNGIFNGFKKYGLI